MLLFQTIWVDLEGIMLSAITQMKKDKNHIISFTCGIQKTKKKQTKQKPTHRYKQRIGGYKRRYGMVGDKMVNGDEMSGGRWKRNFWWKLNTL